MKKSKLQKLAESDTQKSSSGVITLLLKDHRAMRKLMATVKSPRSTNAKKVSSFKTLEKLVRSHVKAEEKALLKRIDKHEVFEDEAVEGIEEHRIHNKVMSDIHLIQSPKRKLTRMKIFCEFLEHHLDEEEEDLFPKFRKYAALTTRKKMGTIFLEKRKNTTSTKER